MILSFRNVAESESLVGLIRRFNFAMQAVVKAVANQGEFLDARDADATPSVAGGIRRVLFANTAPTVITALDGGQVGQEVELRSTNGNTTLDFTSTTLKGNGGVDLALSATKGVRCSRGQDGNWFCWVIGA